MSFANGNSWLHTGVTIATMMTNHLYYGYSFIATWLINPLDIASYNFDDKILVKIIHQYFEFTASNSIQ